MRRIIEDDFEIMKAFVEGKKLYVKYYVGGEQLITTAYILACLIKEYEIAEYIYYED